MRGEPFGGPEKLSNLNEGPSPKEGGEEVPQSGLSLKKTLPQRRRPALTRTLARPMRHSVASDVLEWWS